MRHYIPPNQQVKTAFFYTKNNELQSALNRHANVGNNVTMYSFHKVGFIDSYFLKKMKKTQLFWHYAPLFFYL
jgi:hypothetical protein